MKIKLTQTLKKRVSFLNSGVREPAVYEKHRQFLYICSLVLCLFLLPLKFTFDMNMDTKWVCFLSGTIFTGLILLTSMIQPGTKTFWLMFFNILVMTPIIGGYFPFEELINLSEFFEVFFGLFTFWVPIAYLFYTVYINFKMTQKHKICFQERIEATKNIKLKAVRHWQS